VATVESDDPRLIARLEAVEVGAAPLPGRSRTVSAAYARVRVLQIGVDVTRLQFAGPDQVTVTRAAQAVPGRAFRKAACAAVEAANPGATAQVSLVPADLRLPPGTVTFDTEGEGPVSGPSGAVTVRVLVQGREEARVPISFRLQRLAPVLVAARHVPRGHVLTEADLLVEQRPAVAGPLAMTASAQAVGQELSVPLRAGAPLRESMLRPAVLVKRGARIRLVCRPPGFVATVTGEALQDGAAGQPIRVRNLSSRRDLTGFITDEQTVEVSF
jgi:flagella basal body P-ring formation protein FlgA